ncbi:OmpA family protein [Litoreibacter janthinus]|uniref:Outer membrane protein OmpA n=1 Tax=Litoreibacter janthinus TaxID=670154 RepID=A0A1I6FTH9_9RHOB|nr:OmpA family protein [Litoreibacter janthinus]SFR33208.1 Outer membrane protein OmpA [Litoreibacter janthinus]
MGFFGASNAAKYRAEGLSLMQASRIDSSLAKNDFKRTLILAGLAFLLVGTVSFIAVQTASRTSEVAAVASPPAPAAPIELAALVTRPQPVSFVPKDASQVTPPEPARLIPASAVAPQRDMPVAGFTNVMPEPPTPDVAAVAEAPRALSCVAELARLAERSTIYFNIGSAQISGTDLVRLSTIARAANDCPDAQIQVTGHSDTTGSDMINFDLSWKRADNTVLAIAAQGLDTSHFEPVGFGARSPVSEGSTSDEDVNRRVEFVVLRRDPNL